MRKLRQCRKIFAGELNSWTDVGGPSEPIVVVIPPETSDEVVAFRDLILKGAQFAKNVHVTSRWKAAIRGVAGNKAAIGLCSIRFAYRTGSEIKVVGLKENAKAVAVLPSLHGQYGERYPLRRPIYFYWDGNSRLREEIERLVEYTVHHGLEIYR